jgi:hypothetical protein
LRRVFGCLARRRGFGTCLHEFLAQRDTLAFQLGKLLPQFLKLREVVVHEQRHVLLDSGIRMLKLRFE